MKIMVSIVVDASVARSCGDSTAIHPLPIQCRDFLLVMQEHRHSVVMTKEIRAEWDKHQSRFALTWLRQMVAKKQFKPIPLPEIDPEIWELMEALAKTDNQRAEMTKDILLLEAALATDRRIVSLDEKTARKYFTNAAKESVKLQALVWVNPSKEEENPIEWLKCDAPADPERMLGYLG
jgi:hypothetical protein